jgi:hypothetical protein
MTTIIIIGIVFIGVVSFDVYVTLKWMCAIKKGWQTKPLIVERTYTPVKFKSSFVIPRDILQYYQGNPKGLIDNEKLNKAREIGEHLLLKGFIKIREDGVMRADGGIQYELEITVYEGQDRPQ